MRRHAPLIASWMRPRGSSDSGRAFWRVPFVFRAIHERGRTSGASLNLHCVPIARIVRLPLRIESRYMLHALEALNSRYFLLCICIYGERFPGCQQLCIAAALRRLVVSVSYACHTGHFRSRLSLVGTEFLDHDWPLSVPRANDPIAFEKFNPDRA